MVTRNHALLTALVVVSAVLVSAGPTYALPRKLQAGDLISQLCAKTHYADICLGSVKGFVQGTASVISVLHAEINACAKETNAAITQVTKLSKAASSGEKETLSICKENYEFAIDSLTKAKAAISARDLGTLNAELGAVVTYAGTCDDAYDEMEYVSPLTKVDQLLMGLGSNCLAIAAQIRW